MTTLHFVHKARRARPNHGIAKGDSYYWWAHRIGRLSSKHYSKTRPRPSALTASDFLSEVYSAQEDIEDAVRALEGTPSRGCWDALVVAVEDARSTLESQASECRDRFDNMPSGLQQGPTGQLLEERSSWCEDLTQEIDAALGNLPDRDNPMAWEGVALLQSVEGLDWSSAP